MVEKSRRTPANWNVDLLDQNQHGEKPCGSRQDAPDALERENCGDGGRGQTEDFEEEASLLWENLPSRDVVFSPFADCDLAPLQRISHLASVYVLCDWRFGPEMFDWLVARVGRESPIYSGLEPRPEDAENPVYAVPDDQARAVSGVSEDFGLAKFSWWTAGNQPWCRITRLNRRAGKTTRPVWLVCVGGNCVEIYQRLFVDRGAAPKVLWLQPPLGTKRCEWAKFVSPVGLFGRVFTEAPRQPVYVAAHEHLPGWQQRVLYQRLIFNNMPPWELILYAVPGAPPERVAGARSSAGRRVVVDPAPIHPSRIAKDDLIVLTLAEYQRHVWPDAQVVFNIHWSEAVEGEVLDRERTLVMRGKPMDTALQLLEAYCQEHGYRRVALTRCGFEDEGPALVEWQARNGHIEKITFHCETIGDLVSLGPWA